MFRIIITRNVSIGKAHLQEFKQGILHILQEDLASVSEDLLSVSTDMIDLTSTRLLRSVSLQLIKFDQYRHFQTCMEKFSRLDDFDLRMLTDDNFGTDFTSEDLALIQSLDHDFTNQGLHSEFKFDKNVIDDFGFFYKHVFVSETSKIGVIYLRPSHVKSELAREMLFWDLLGMAETLGWNLAVINLDNSIAPENVKSAILKLMSTL